MRPDLHPAPVQRAASAEPASRGLPSDGGGQPLPGDVQAKMEGAFGTDFSAVRIHQGPRSEALGAHAYTQGTDIHFAPGQYRPGSRSGQELLGHELAHVVQQSRGRVSAITQLKGVELNDDAGLEREADEMGTKAARGERVLARGAVPAQTDGAGVQAKAGIQAHAIVQRSQRDGTQLPTSAEQQATAVNLDPRLRNASHAGPDNTPWDGDEGTLATELWGALTGYLSGRGAELGDKKAAPRVAMPGVNGIVDVVKHLLDEHYGAWVVGAVRTGGQLARLTGPLNVIDANDEDARLAMIGKTGKHYEVAMDTAFWVVGNDPTARDVMRAHHFVPRRTPEESQAIDRIIDQYVRYGTNGQGLFDLMLYGMNQHGAGGIALSTATNPGVHGANAEKVQRWAIFGKAMHEIMHGLAHPAFLAAANARPVMEEGFCEYFAARISAPTIDAARSGGAEDLRHAVEGDTAALDPTAIPPYVSPSEYAGYLPEVQEIRDRIGENGLLAAYFQGHVEFLGLARDGGMGTQLRPDVGVAPIEVPTEITTIARLAEASGVAADRIALDNPDLLDPLHAGQPVVLTGCREHTVVGTSDDGGAATETRAQIAAQHEVTEDALMRANPGIAFVMGGQWAPLGVGEKILVPAA